MYAPDSSFINIYTKISCCYYGEIMSVYCKTISNEEISKILRYSSAQLDKIGNTSPEDMEAMKENIQLVGDVMDFILYGPKSGVTEQTFKQKYELLKERMSHI